MSKRFNISGICYPKKHYMVNLDKRLSQMKEMVDEGDYFIINRARQFGKTTTLHALTDYLKEEYVVIPTSFQGLSAVKFQSEYRFSKAFAEMILETLMVDDQVIEDVTETDVQELKRAADEETTLDMVELFGLISCVCKNAAKPVVLLIDEVDSASNNQVFLDFLGLLRDYYLKRERKATFQSVILAGVYDIKNLKQKIRTEDEHKYNSPWNIAAPFEIDMSFSADEIAEMLEEYKNDYRLKINVRDIAELIYDYTCGYPYLVSSICKITHDRMVNTDMKSGCGWEKEDILGAVKQLLNSRNTLFDDMMKHLEEHHELNQMLQNILFRGMRYPYNAYNQAINIGEMFGFVKNMQGDVAVANRIFEICLYDYYISEERTKAQNTPISNIDKNQFIKDGMLDMDKVLRKFTEYFADIYREQDTEFVEKYGRKIFLLYLKPIINGTGNYYVEAQTRDMGRTDIVVDYKGEQFVIELKIWHGIEYNTRGEKQLMEYLDFYHLKKGYMLSFNFNKSKQVGVKEIVIGEKVLVEAVV